MFIKKTTGLCHLVTFLTPNAMFFNNVVDVTDNVFAVDGTYRHFVIMGKKKTHFLCVIANGAGRIMFGGKHIA